MYYFEVSDNNNENGQIYLYNINGQLKLQKTQNEEGVFKLDASELSEGIYFYKLIIDDKVYTGKVLKN